MDFDGHNLGDDESKSYQGIGEAMTAISLVSRLLIRQDDDSVEGMLSVHRNRQPAR
jgi:hypothetical protein